VAENAGGVATGNMSGRLQSGSTCTGWWVYVQNGHNNSTSASAWNSITVHDTNICIVYCVVLCVWVWVC